MTVVEKVQKDKRLSMYDGIWVCTFALCQFGEDLGARLDTSPFVKALLCADHVVLVVDRASGSLSRTWCAFELQLSAQESKALDLFAPTGKVGSEGASSVALLDAVEAWDIRSTEASNAADRRQILNRVAGIDELTGIKKDEQGRPVVDRGRKVLEDTRLDPHEQRALKGRPEFAHEALIFSEHQGNFEQLNSLVRGKVKNSFGAHLRTRGCKISDPAFRGITLGQLKKFFRHAMRKFRRSWDSILVSEIAAYVWQELKPKIHGEPCSFLETVAEAPVPPEVFVSYSNAGSFADLVRSLEWQAEAREFDDNTPFFFDILCIAQEEMRIVSDESFHTIAAQESEGILVCHGCDRGWVLHNIAAFLTTDKLVDFGSESGVLACTRPFRDGSWECGQFSKAQLQKLLLLKCDKVCMGSCSEEEFVHVKQRIAACFPHVPPQEAAALFEESLRRFATGPLLRGAASHGDRVFIRKVCAAPGMLITNKSNRGSLGEMPVHLAAASGDVHALRTCLDLKADPNAEDVMRERPLHYAALVGCAPAVQVLLRANADPTVRSAFMETPLDVARENAAAFLGVKTDTIQDLLSSAEELEWKLASAQAFNEDPEPLELDSAVLLSLREVPDERKLAETASAPVSQTQTQKFADQEIAAQSQEMDWLNLVICAFEKIGGGTMTKDALIETLSTLLKEDASLLVEALACGQQDIQVRDFLELLVQAK